MPKIRGNKYVDYRRNMVGAKPDEPMNEEIFDRMAEEKQGLSAGQRARDLAHARRVVAGLTMAVGAMMPPPEQP